MRKITPILFVAACLLCMGMGGSGDDGVVRKIPEPDRKFSVELVDAADTSFEVESFSVEGLTFVPVEMGRADVALDFATIDSATFLLRDDSVRAEVKFTDGETNAVSIDPDLAFYGRCRWGNLRLKARDIRAITFHHPGR